MSRSAGLSMKKFESPQGQVRLKPAQLFSDKTDQSGVDSVALSRWVFCDKTLVSTQKLQPLGNRFTTKNLS